MVVFCHCGCYGGTSKIMLATVDRGLLSGFSVGLRNNNDFAVSDILFTNEKLIFARLIVNNSTICVVFFYALEQYRV